MKFFPGEELEQLSSDEDVTINISDEDVNQKYAKGEVRIVTEQARYPLPTIKTMVESGNYELNPEFQRRHRWDNVKQSHLIESFIMNVPIPPIFLYEDRFSHYEVMDGLQRLSTIHSFYTDKLVLEGLKEWPELNGKTYSQLPNLIKKGVDRRYLSSIILLQETAKSEIEAQRLKQLVFERINSGGVQLSGQESRNAIYNGNLNKLCIKLSRNSYLCKMWGIPEPQFNSQNEEIISNDLLENKLFSSMGDVELVLRFFANRQKQELQKGALRQYLDLYLKNGNLFADDLLNRLELLFTDTVKLVYDVLGEKAFYMFRLRKGVWSWYKRPTTTIFDTLMYTFSEQLDNAEKLIQNRVLIKEKLEQLYKDQYEIFEGRNVNSSFIEQRKKCFNELLKSVLEKK